MNGGLDKVPEYVRAWSARHGRQQTAEVFTPLQSPACGGRLDRCDSGEKGESRAPVFAVGGCQTSAVEPSLLRRALGAVATETGSPPAMCPGHSGRGKRSVVLYSLWGGFVRSPRRSPACSAQS
ncbi:hypothetical protein NDU88_004227 [Pleurodeles waltl]|uniref:Uncharacterized protein n=1 Tax=Pleurodeles waltl TaxID=8319 RepID=A0AAV7QE61_PLEWA|nr:hypothetical protein NDU88_004227 [Pleurodeles waltl]